MPETERPAAKALLHRLRTDRSLRALLSGEGAATNDNGDFAATALEPEAIYQFNCIIWEPGFPTKLNGST
jgi:hypothetical protein